MDSILAWYVLYETIWSMERRGERVRRIGHYLTTFRKSAVLFYA